MFMKTSKCLRNQHPLIKIGESFISMSTNILKYLYTCNIEKIISNNLLFNTIFIQTHVLFFIIIITFIIITFAKNVLSY